MKTTRLLGGALLALFGVGVLVQFLPYGRDHRNPPVGEEVVWDAPRTEELARRACYDCHSNETRWPWYSNIAPISWRIQNHVEEGRAKLNFSDFTPADEEVAEAAGEAAETLDNGEMPPFDYLMAHAEARLNPTEQQELSFGLSRTFAAFVEKPGGRGGDSSGGGGREEREAEGRE